MRRLTSFSPQIFTLFALVTLTTTTLASPASADGLRTSPPQRPASTTSPQPSPPQPSTLEINGNLYVAQTLNDLEHYHSIAAKIRYESRLQNQTIHGTGEYWQERTDNQRNTRWEIQMQISDQTASFLQIYIGKDNYLWTDVRLPSKHEVRRLDTAWLQNKLRVHYRTAETDQREQALLAAVGQGGLRQMMSDLLRNFDFQPPQAKQLNGLSVHALIGHWRPERLAQLWPAAAQQASDPTAWPEQIPHHVLLLVNRKNGMPHLCEYRSAADADLATSFTGLHPTPKPLLRYELYDVKFAVAIPPELFKYNSGEIIPIDETQHVFNQITAKPEPTMQAAAKPASSKTKHK